MGFTTDPKMVRVDIFKESGKWYTTLEVKWLDYKACDLRQVLRDSIAEQNSGNFEGMFAVCLKPYSLYEHPQMIKL